MRGPTGGWRSSCAEPRRRRLAPKPTPAEMRPGPREWQGRPAARPLTPEPAQAAPARLRAAGRRLPVFAASAGVVSFFAVFFA